MSPSPTKDSAKSKEKERSKNNLSLDISLLKKELKKWEAAMNLIGRTCPDIGDTAYKIEENVINYLSAIEGVSMPCARYNILIPDKVYFYTDPKRIKEIKPPEDSSLIEKIYPQPKKAVSSIEKVVEGYIADSLGHGYIQGFEKRKGEIIQELSMIRDKITVPYAPGTEYSSVQKELMQTSEKMQGIKSDYLASLWKLEYQRAWERLKIAAAVGITITTVLIGSKIKKARR